MVICNYRQLCALVGIRKVPTQPNPTHPIQSKPIDLLKQDGFAVTALRCVRPEIGLTVFLGEIRPSGGTRYMAIGRARPEMRVYILASSESRNSLRS